MIFLSYFIVSVNIQQNTPPETNTSRDNLKISKISGRIHINSNWTVAKAAGICTGSGTYNDPYIIEDLIIDGEESGNCIMIENSDIYFRIENCTLYNSGSSYAGILLSHLNNSQIIDNNCSYYNNGKGIVLEYCNNNTISGNIANGNRNYGIYLNQFCNNNTILNNTCNYNGFGIHMYLSSYNTVARNIAIKNQVVGIYVLRSKDNNFIANIIRDSECGIYIYELSYNNNFSSNLMFNCSFRFYGDSQDSQYIDTTNLVNNKFVYYYTHELGLTSINFSNAGQIILIECSNSIISNLDLLNIYLYYSHNITIHHNEIKNDFYGMLFYNCWNNTISENIMKKNEYGINFWGGNSNKILKNQIYNSSYKGIYLYNSDNNQFIGNIVKNTEYIGLDLFHCDDNDLLDNCFNKSSRGLKIDQSNYNTIMGNTACENSYDGIFLYNTNNNDVLGNIVNNNGEKGINLRNSDNNEVSGNTVNYNGEQGIYLDNCYSNSIFQNAAKENKIGIELFHNDQTEIFGNIIENCEYAIYINDCHNITITENSLYNCGVGLNGTIEQLISFNINESNTVNGRKIYTYMNISNLKPSNFSNAGQVILIRCNDSIISNLNLTTNSLGISLYYCNNNTFYENIIKDEIYGLYIDHSFNNYFYNNTFIQNAFHVHTFQSSENHLNNSIIGNYWDDYDGFDCDGDGLGETPYIFGDVIDYLPICNKYDIFIPNITILEPSYLQEYQEEVPQYSIIIEEYLLDSYWYTLDGGLNNISINSYNGSIDQKLWNELPFSEVDIVFYAKDVAGNIGYAIVRVLKIKPSSPSILGYNIFLILGFAVLITFLTIKKKFKR